ncbi:MAG: hypothetical protein ACKOTB_10985 [Planctomycetia bacterium]
MTYTLSFSKVVMAARSLSQCSMSIEGALEPTVSFSAWAAGARKHARKHATVEIFTNVMVDLDAW